MKVYSDEVLKPSDFWTAAQTAGCMVVVEGQHKGRLRSVCWPVKLAGHWGTSGRRRNTGTHGADDVTAASWDQHGWWMAEVFKRDPRAIIVGCGRYVGVLDFHAKTKGKYFGGWH